MVAALILVDVQYDFLPPSGALAVPTGDAILPHVYRLLEEGEWGIVVASQDYHPRGHVSFASRHGRSPFSSIEVPLPPSRGGGQITQELWPDHCVQGTRGCELEEGVRKRLDAIQASGGKIEVIQKGCDVDLDAYSAFAIPLSAANQDESPLARTLFGARPSALASHVTSSPSFPPVDANIDTVVVCGLATDFCVRATVLAALESAQGARVAWRVLVVREGVKGVFADKEEEVLQELRTRGAEVVEMDGPELQPLLRRRS
ncbi:hypothetical protein JCM6882_004877 [Rhodosporidiobolus microsporus]